MAGNECIICNPEFKNRQDSMDIFVVQKRIKKEERFTKPT